MFRLVKDPAAPWPVRFNDVDADGRVVEREITLRFRRLGVRAFHDLFLEMPDDLEAALAYTRHAWDRTVSGWEGVLDEAGSNLPMTDEAVARMLDWPGFARAFREAYCRFFDAIPEEREKNSGASPGGGPGATQPTAEVPPTTSP